MGGNTRLWLLLLALVAGCAAASSVPDDAGVDMTASACDPKTLFSACSAQCGMPICVVAAATCNGTVWTCDCMKAAACGPDMRQTD